MISRPNIFQPRHPLLAFLTMPFSTVKKASLIALAAFWAMTSTVVLAQQHVPDQVSIVEPGKAELAAAQELIDVVMPPAQRQSMVNGIVQSMMQNITGGMMQSPKMQEAFQEFPAMRGVFQKFIDREEKKALQMMQDEMPSMIEAMSRAYARSFTVAQLEEMNVFFASPTGQVYVTKSMAIMSDPDVAKWQRDVMQKSMADMPAATEELMAELLAVAQAAPAQ